MMEVQKSKQQPSGELKVAIVGGGIAGVTLALGLLARGIQTSVYERCESFREIGAGIGFTANAERAMIALDPRIHAAFKSVTVKNGTDWFMWMDGYTQHGPDTATHQDQLIHKMYLGERGFEGCHRADFLDELIKLMPAGTVQFHKKLEKVEDEEEKQLELKFGDNSTALADIVIGCDGIRSKVRQLMLGSDSPAANPTYTHKYAFRGLIPMTTARPVLGLEKTETRHMYLGQDGHALTFPVAGGNLLNVVAFAPDAGEWTDPIKFTAPAKKEDAVRAFSKFNSTVRSIIDLLPDQLDRWAIFDTYDHPPPTYVQGRMCIAGDAAHAAAPYHGAGAGFAIEDGAVLAHLIKTVKDQVELSTVSRSAALTAALETYNAVRLDRARWLVQSSRFVGRMYQWQDEGVGSDPVKSADEIEWRSRKIWDYDIMGMLEEATQELTRRMPMLATDKADLVVSTVSESLGSNAITVG